MNRTSIVVYADQFWWQPCRDGNVWLNNRPIIISAERRKRSLSEPEWAAVFLNYDFEKYFDGLYFIRRTQVPRLPAYQYYAPSITPPSDLVLVQLWEGLNDCAHFVSECLKEGGVGVYTLGVGELVSKLRALSDTKTLAYFVDLPAAERIVTSGIMQKGDIIAFGAANKTFVHGHSTIYMGSNKVANHTHLNHPAFTGGGGLYGGGIWQRYADPDTGHPLVILIHFSEGDADSVQLASSSTLGWWKVTWQGTTYYYFFDKKNGRVSWTSTKPLNINQGPVAPQGKGYWFETPADLKICWTNTGSYEVYHRASGVTSMSGECNDVPITATKMR